MDRLFGFVVVVALLALATAGPVEAAELTAATGYTAAPGERNDVTIVSIPHKSLTVRDVVPIDAGEGCVSEPVEDGWSGTCSGNPSQRIELADGDDVARIDPASVKPPQQFYFFDGPAIYGGRGDDRLYGGPVSGRQFGGPGDDELVGGSGLEESLMGNDGDDVLRGGAEYENLRGAAGADLLIGGPGQDRFDGGAGDDVFHAKDPGGADEFNESVECGAETDEVFAGPEDFAWECERVHRPGGDDAPTVAAPTRGGAWGDPVYLGDVDWIGDLALTRRNEAVGLWSHGGDVVTRTRRADGTLTPERLVRHGAGVSLTTAADTVIASWFSDAWDSVTVAAIAGGEPQSPVTIPGIAPPIAMAVSHSGQVAMVGVEPSDQWPRRTQLVVSQRSATGEWPAAVPVGEPLPVGASTVPAAALTNAGELVVAWKELGADDNAPQPIRTISRRPDGSVTTPVTLASDAENWPTLGVDAAGRAVLAFQPGESGFARVRFRDAAGAWGHPIEVDADPASLVVSRSGEVLMTPSWSGQPTVLSGPFGGPLTSHPIAGITPNAPVSGTQPSLATSRSGHAVVALKWSTSVVWGYMPDDDAGYALTAARSPAGTWRSLEDLRTDCSPVDDIRVAVNDAGAAAALTVRDGRATLSSSAPSPGPPVRGCTPDPAPLGWEWEQTQSRYPPVPGVAPQPAPEIAVGAPPAGPGAPAQAMRVRQIRLAGTRRHPAARVTLSCPASCRVTARADLRTTKRSVRRGARSLRLARAGRKVIRVPLRGTRRLPARGLRLDVRVTAKASNGRRWSARRVQRVFPVAVWNSAPKP